MSEGDDPKPIKIDWDKPEPPPEPAERTVQIGVVDDPTHFDLGFSSKFPEGIMLYFATTGAALVFEGKAKDKLLTNMVEVLMMTGVLQDAEEFGEEPPSGSRKITFH